MATSAATLSEILELLGKTYGFEVDAAVALLAPKGYLPKKLTESPKVKKTSKFASKQAGDYATDLGLTIPKGFKGTANGGKISKKDLKLLAEGPKKVKVNASPSALQEAREADIDITKVTGTGTDGKILLKDIRGLKPAAKTESTKAPLKITPKARQVMKKYDIDEGDLIKALIKGTGKDGRIIEKDLAEIVAEIKADEEREARGEPEPDSDATVDESDEED